MRTVLGLATVCLLASLGSAAALAAPTTTRVRGTIATASGDQLTVKTYDGTTVDLELTDATKYISVLPAALKDIKPGEFVGIGATGPENAIVGMEVVIFPSSMRGTGEGHYAWSVPAAVANADRHLGTSTPPGAPPVQGTMTNGTVSSAAANNAGPPVQGTMTNGTVAAGSGAPRTGANGGQELTITYDHGGSVHILVPANAPVVRLAPASRSIVQPGAKVFAVAAAASGGAASAARFVAVGANGLMPPM